MRDGFIAKSFLTPTSIASGFLLLALCKQLSLRLIPSFTVERLKKAYFLLKIGFSFNLNYGILLLYRKYSDACVFRSF